MYIQREIQDKFDKLKKVYTIITLVGARQAGKTTFLKEQIKEKNSSYLLFDDPDIKEVFDKDIKKFEEKYIKEKDISVLDEVQYCKEAGAKLKYLADSGHKIWLTSSSEAILGKEVLSYLVGRTSVLRLYPFSLKEFFKIKNPISENEILREIENHILFGGYPKCCLNDDIEIKKTILRDLYTTMVLKDIARVFSIQDINLLETFSKYIAINTGSVFSYDSTSRDLKTSFISIKKYLDAMEKSYLIKRINPFFTNKLKEITKQPKVYFIDTGMRNIIISNFQEVTGQMFENYVFSELVKLGFEINYWRTKSKEEVDFIIRKESEIIPVEVKISECNPEKSLKKFIEEYKPKKAFIVFLKGKRKKMKINNCQVICCNVVDFLDEIGL